MKGKRLNIYQLYVSNGCRFGFFVRRDTWEPGRYAKVVGIESVENGVKIDEITGLGFITLEADWLIGGVVEIDSGGEYCWEHV